jgi:hypothetical protein
MNDVAEELATPGEIGRRHLAFEDGILEVVAEIPHGAEHAAEPFVVADVVADQIGVSHGGTSKGEAVQPSMTANAAFPRRQPGCSQV